MRLEITKIYNCAKVAFLLRKYFYVTSARDALDATKKLPIIIEFVDLPILKIKELFDNIAEYIYLEEYKPSPDVYAGLEEESKAWKWYDSLSDDEKDMIRVIIRSSIPVG